MRQTRKICYDFRGHQKYPAVVSGAGAPWSQKITGSGGTVTGAAGGGLTLAFDNTSEVANICLYMGDILSFALADLIRFEFVCKLSASMAAANSAVFGLGSARNDTVDSVTYNAWFKVDGSNAVVAETDDNTTDTDDKSTGLSLSTTFTRFAIDFSMGSNTRSPPSLSQNGMSNVQFYMGNANSALRRVASGTRFDLSGAASANVQPIFQIQKTTGTSTGSLTILEACAEVLLPC